MQFNKTENPEEARYVFIDEELRFYNGILKENAGVNKRDEKKINQKPL